MAASLDSSSPAPTHIHKEIMVSSPIFSPASDKRFWSSFRTRIDSLLENRKCKACVSQDQLNSNSMSAGGSDRAKRLKEDSLLLIRGFDSVAHSLSQLSNNLDNALQGAKFLAEPPTLRQIFQSNLEDYEIEQDDTEKPNHGEKEEVKQEGEGEENNNQGLKRKFDQTCNSVDEESHSRKETEQNLKDDKLKKAKNLAVSMAAKAASLARELKSLKSELCFLQERCSLLEEDNRKLRDGFSKGIRPEEDDLMRLQMEALLAEKSRLATENANLTRENQCLQQLVEYHQITSHDLSASYEQLIQGISLDFSSPLKEEADDSDMEDFQTPGANAFALSASLDKCFQEEKQ